ncbi:sugar ABC transporter ATP-binding protein [Kibdelosporangium lantanae]
MLEAAHVTKRLAGVTALRGADFLLERGQVHALVGEPGAGKSTLVKVLTGVYQPDSGLVFHKGRPVRFTGPRDAQRHGVGVVHQEGNLVGSMSVAANLYLGDEPRNRLGLVSFRQMRTGATRLLDSLGIMVDPAAPVRTLDPAAQQMVAIARAVNTRHRVLVLDEPTSSLEPPEVATLFDVIRRLHEQDVAVLYASNRLADVLQVCTAVTVLQAGRTVHSGRLTEVDPLELIAATSPARRPDNVDIDIRPGETGQLDPDVRSGSPLITAGVVLVPEDRMAEGILPHLSVRENIVLAALPRMSRFGWAARSKQDAVVRALVRRLRVRATDLDQRAGDLSPSDQRKVTLARWLAMSAKVLLLDEPDMDVRTRAEVNSLVDELAAYGLKVNVVASDVTELVDGADRVVVVRAGAQVAELRGAEVTPAAVLSAIKGAA